MLASRRTSSRSRTRTTQPPPLSLGLPRTRLPYCPAIWQDDRSDAMSVHGLRREDFPVLDRLTYLNTASAGLVPASVMAPAHEFELELAQAGTTGKGAARGRWPGQARAAGGQSAPGWSMGTG